MVDKSIFINLILLFCLFTCNLVYCKCAVSHLCGCANVLGTCENYQKFARTLRTYWIWVQCKNGRQILSRFFGDIAHTLDVHFHVWNRDVFEKIENLQMTKNTFCTSVLGYAHHDNAKKLKINQLKKCS